LQASIIIDEGNVASDFPIAAGEFIIGRAWVSRDRDDARHAAIGGESVPRLIRRNATGTRRYIRFPTTGGILGRRTITINRAPVLTLWASVVARRLGFEREEALTLGRAVAGLNTYAHGAALGLLAPSRKSIKERRREMKAGKRIRVDLLKRAVPVVRTRNGLRALSKDRPIAPAGVEQYLEIKFGDALKLVRSAMKRLARSMSAPEIAAQADELYEKFRPKIPVGEPGWGAEGKLDVDRIERLGAAKAARRRA
jgi:hypothetical protein